MGPLWRIWVTPRSTCYIDYISASEIAACGPKMARGAIKMARERLVTNVWLAKIFWAFFWPAAKSILEQDYNATCRSHCNHELCDQMYAKVHAVTPIAKVYLVTSIAKLHLVYIYTERGILLLIKSILYSCYWSKIVSTVCTKDSLSVCWPVTVNMQYWQFVRTLLTYGICVFMLCLILNFIWFDLNVN